VAANTAIAGAFGAVVSMFYMQIKTGKPDPGMMANGMLGGLVAITAPCAFVDPWAAAVIGIIAGVLVPWAVGFVENRGIDDPVGAIAVHGFGGGFGVLAVGIFANGTYGAGWNATTGTEMADSGKGVIGILGGDLSLGLGQLGAQAIGLLTIWTVIFGIAFAFFKIQNAIMKGGIRSNEADEIAGLDLPEMGALAYPEFEFAIEHSDPEIGERPLVGSTGGSLPHDEA
jgi:Amt family ammonium transporter